MVCEAQLHSIGDSPLEQCMPPSAMLARQICSWNRQHRMHNANKYRRRLTLKKSENMASCTHFDTSTTFSSLAGGPSAAPVCCTGRAH